MFIHLKTRYVILSILLHHLSHQLSAVDAVGGAVHIDDNQSGYPIWEYPNNAPQASVPTEYKRCRIESGTGQDGLSCRYDSQLTISNKIDDLVLTCNQYSKTTNETTCDSAFAAAEKVCTVTLTLTVEPKGPTKFFPDKKGCNEQKVLFKVHLYGKLYSHKTGLVFNEKFAAAKTLVMLQIDDIGLNSEQMSDLLEKNFYMAETIELRNNPGLTELNIDQEIFPNLNRLIILNSTQFNTIRSNTFQLNQSYRLLSIVNSSFAKGVLGQGAIVIKEPRCRTENLTIELINVTLSTNVVRNDPIKIDIDDNTCPDNQVPSRIFVNLKKNKFANLFPAPIFKKLIDDGKALAENNKTFGIRTDYIDCCHETNSWLFANGTNYRDFIRTEGCSTYDGSSSRLDFRAIKNQTASCGTIQKGGNGLKTYAILLAALIIIGLIAMLVGCLVMQGGDKTSRDRARWQEKHDRRSRSESAAAKARHDGSDHAARPHSKSRSIKSDGLKSGSKRKTEPPAQFSDLLALKSKKSNSILDQTDSKATGRSPTSPKFVRLVSPERKRTGSK